MNEALACRKQGKFALVAATILQKLNDKQMKTPIQELIEVVKQSKKDQPQPHFWKYEVLELLNLALNKEKEAIQQAFYEGMLCQGFDPNMGRAEMYYNEVYKK